ncbi:unnamed protein product [Prunus armeniaca]
MIHVMVHLPGEALLASPVNYRWMYPIERLLEELKKTVRNRAKPEGLIIEAWVQYELLNFCEMYLKYAETTFNRPQRNNDGGVRNEKLSVFAQGARPFGDPARGESFSINDMEVAHWFVLNNCDEIMAYLDEHKEMMKREHPSHLYAKKHHELFPQWFLEYTPWFLSLLRCLPFPILSPSITTTSIHLNPRNRHRTRPPPPLSSSLSFDPSPSRYFLPPQPPHPTTSTHEIGARRTEPPPPSNSSPFPTVTVTPAAGNHSKLGRVGSLALNFENFPVIIIALDTYALSASVVVRSQEEHLGALSPVEDDEGHRVTNSRINIRYDERHRPAPMAELHRSLAHDIGHIVWTHCPMIWKSWKEGCSKEFEEKDSWVWLYDVYVRPWNELAESLHVNDDDGEEPVGSSGVRLPTSSLYSTQVCRSSTGYGVSDPDGDLGSDSWEEARDLLLRDRECPVAGTSTSFIVAVKRGDCFDTNGGRHSNPAFWSLVDLRAVQPKHGHKIFAPVDNVQTFEPHLPNDQVDFETSFD